MRAVDLPPIFAGLNLPHVYKVAGEFRGPCPQCGGDDRFVMWEEAQATGRPMGWCRQCGYTYHPERESGNEIDEQTRAYFAAERLKRAEQERKEQAERRELFRQVPWWETYHDNLDKFPRARQIWRDRYGLGDWALTYYRLGYCPDLLYMAGGEECHSDTLTIPVFKPGTRYEVVNLRHRLLDPEEKGGKYRPHTSGLGQPLFFANLNMQPEALPYVLIVEGEIKAACIWERAMLPVLADRADRLTEWFVTHVQVIGITGTSLSADNLARLQHIERLYIAFDPDANEREGRKPSLAERFAHKFENSRRRIIALPGKPDDLLVAGAMAIPDLVRYMRNGRAA